MTFMSDTIGGMAFQNTSGSDRVWLVASNLVVVAVGATSAIANVTGTLSVWSSRPQTGSQVVWSNMSDYVTGTAASPQKTLTTESLSSLVVVPAGYYLSLAIGSESVSGGGGDPGIQLNIQANPGSFNTVTYLQIIDQGPAV